MPLFTSKGNALNLTVYIVTLLTGWPSNLLALHAFYQKLRRKPTPGTIFLFNLTLSDLFFLTFLPFKTIEAAAGNIWSLPAYLCPLSGLFHYSTIYSSILFLTAVSVDRYLGVAFPFCYKMHRKPSYALAVSLFLWVCAFTHCSIVYITELRRDWSEAATNLSVCYDNFTPQQLAVLLPVRLELGIILFCVPLLITCFCYCSFTWIVMSSAHLHKEKKRRAVGLVLATLAVFLICFTPYNVSHIVGYIQGSSPGWRDEALLFSTFNACLDPIIFYFSSTAVQQSCWTCLRTLGIKKCTGSPFQYLSNTFRSRKNESSGEVQCTKL
ncbi:free fatty acid receptor 2-like [Polyodon spathula]|uniref:free fatty acid receptor 2-like n=1 Tax=Polyodon spathula TaxID=7913 RepID=UPI001B7DD883|nr:free fatty acid receptor 2-like [Polyodon spathula]